MGEVARRVKLADLEDSSRLHRAILRPSGPSKTCSVVPRPATTW